MFMQARMLRASSSLRRAASLLSPRSYRCFSASTGVTEQADIIVVGAGVMGLNTAYQLARRTENKTIVVLEKGGTVGEGSSGASSSILRHMYSFENMVNLAKDGIDCYKDWGNYTGLKSPTARFHQVGVLWFGGKSAADVDKDVAKLTKFGVKAEALDKQALHEKFPKLTACFPYFDNFGIHEHECADMETETVVYEDEAGYFDPTSSMDDLVTACTRDGVSVRFGAEVVGVQQEQGSVTGVTYSNKKGQDVIVEAPIVINCSGPWVNNMLELAKVSVPLTFAATRIQVCYKKVDKDIIDCTTNTSAIPVVCDIQSGVYFRPQIASGQVLCGSVREEDEEEEVDPDDFNRTCDPDNRMRFLSGLHHRVEDLPTKGEVVGMSGLYTVCKEDFHPAIGEAQDLTGFYICNGFSGHGFKCAPAVGSMMAQLVTDQKLDSFETGASSEFFSPYRAPLVFDNKNVLA